jgi:hypothetical protein
MAAVAGSFFALVAVLVPELPAGTVFAVAGAVCVATAVGEGAEDVAVAAGGLDCARFAVVTVGTLPQPTAARRRTERTSGVSLVRMCTSLYLRSVKVSQ